MNTNQNIADDLLKQKDYQKALQTYLDVLQEYPDDGRIYQAIAKCYYELQKFDESFTACMEAVRLNQNLSIPHLVLAYIYHKNGDQENAIAEAQKAYDLSPEMEEIGNCYSALLLSSGKLDESVEVLKQILEIHPKSELAHQNLAVAYREKRDYKKYTEEISIAYKSNPTLYNAIQILVAYQQRYAFFLSLIVLIALLGALLGRFKILLLIPAFAAIQGLLADLKFIMDSRWKKNGKLNVLLFSLITDCALAAVTYAVYIALSSE